MPQKRSEEKEFDPKRSLFNCSCVCVLNEYITNKVFAGVCVCVFVRWYEFANT